MKIKSIITIMIMSVFMLKCSLTKLTVRQMVGMMDKSRATFETEDDLEMAEMGLAGNLKLLEGMSLHDPDNEDLNLFLAEGFAQFSLAFVEDKKEEYEFTNEDLSEYHGRRAVRMYNRSKRYSAKVLLPALGVKSLDNLNEAQLKQKLAKLDKDYIRAVFWYAFAWGSSINLDRENMDAISQVSKVEVLMSQVEKWNPNFYFGGAYMFKAIYYGSRSKAMGGKPKISKANFEKAMAVTKKKFLIVSYFYAKTYCVQFQDKKCFEENLQYVLDTPANVYPEQLLANYFAKKKAKRLLKYKSELFLD